MRVQPEYFEPIHAETTKRWEQLEADPGLAGPWKQLFNQVQSPRHVLSELLQNADDAGATWAAARLKQNSFYFAHNGKDFDENSFRSLCNFGYSNKRHLHTIGFRGMGFKSTFSLGPRVEVWTPTIAVAFEKKRFTQPIWVAEAPQYKEFTTIRIVIESKEKISWLQRNFELWLSSSIPLLFFTNIRQIELQGQTVNKVVQGPGPVPNSEWVILESKQNSRILHCWSDLQSLPPEAIAEFREERGNPDLDLPPCEVHILLGVQESQRIYVVLPTEVALELPFSCNAPFIPDPARTGIKEPINSPTNNWLLGRVGELAASVMKLWLQNDTLPSDERAQAYRFLPPVLVGQNSLQGSCQKVIADAISKNLTGSPFLLSEGDYLATTKECLGLPAALLDVWQASELLQIFAAAHSCVLSRYVDETARKKLIQWGWLQSAPSDLILKILCQTPYPPKPDNLTRLALLWAYLFKAANEARSWWQHKELAIVPVQNQMSLFPAKEVLVVTGKDRQFTEEEWEFLGQFVNMADVDWIEAIKAHEESLEDTWQTVRQLLIALGLDRSVGVEIILRKVAEKIFSGQEIDTQGIQLAHISARINVQIPSGFKFLCQDGKWRSVDEGLLSYTNPNSGEVIPESWAERVTLHNQYDPGQIFRPVWVDWLHSGRSGIRQFILPRKQTKLFYSQQSLEAYFIQRGEDTPSYYPRKRGNYRVDDYNFDEELWLYWESLENERPTIWVELAKMIALDWDDVGMQRSKAQAFQVGNQKLHPVGNEIAASWLYRLRNKPCLLDQFSHPEFPHLLLRLTPETSPLQGIESFLHPDFDRPENFQLLDLLNVRATPSGAGGEVLINRLQSLAKASNPPLGEVIRIYQALDSVCLHASTQELVKIREIFEQQSITYSQNGTWYRLNQVFMRNDDDIPGMVILHSEIASLSLWMRLGIEQSPRLENALDWLRGLPKGKTIKSEDTKRVISILRRAPVTVWNDIGCWLSLDYTWENTDKIRWLALNSGTRTGLFSWVTAQTADVSFLDGGDGNPLAFTGLAQLESTLTYTITKLYPESEPVTLPSWLQALGRNLSRVRTAKRGEQLTEVEIDYASSRIHANRLLQTKLYEAEQLEVTPYMDGQPAGEGRSPMILWLEDFLYIRENSPRSHRDMVKVFTDVFQNPNLRATIRDCIERDPSWIDQYFEHNFNLEDEPAPAIVDEKLQEQTSSIMETGSLYANSSSSQDNMTISSEVDQNLATETNGIQSITDASMGSHERPKNGRAGTSEHRSRKPEEERVAVVFKRIGFVWQSQSNRFVNPDGSWIQRSEAVFDWDEFDIRGTIKNRYWVGSAPLGKGVEIPSEVWELMKASPDAAWLILPDSHGDFLMYQWRELHQMIESRKLSLHPSRYRLTSSNKI